MYAYVFTWITEVETIKTAD